jgi:hypothetical protein
MGKTNKPGVKYCVPSEEEVVSELHYVLKDKALEYSPIELAELTGRAFERAFPGSRREEKLGNALTRGLSVRDRMGSEEGGSMSAEETARYLGITKQSVLNLYHAQKLLGWRTEKQGAVRLPVWQFSERARLPGLDKVLAKLNESGVLDEWGKVGFFLQSQGLLGDRRPLDLLREGAVEKVIRAAENFA